MCLHCRQDARNAAQQRRYRLAVRIGLASMAGAAVIALIIGGLSAIAPDARSLGRAVSQSVRRTVSPPATLSAPGTRAPALEPVVAEGRTVLGDSLFADRVGANVAVTFDTDTLRTRYDWKFEGIVRATLPLVYGPDARVALDAIPSGTFVRGGNLVRDLPLRGIPLVLPSRDVTIRVWPVTRPGRDGPLVIGYRVTAVR